MDNYCKTCLHDGVDIGFCDKCYYNHILEEKGIPPTKYEAKPKPTNADRIRAMTDEELAELWWERVDCGECPVHKECKLTGQDCKRLALDWLKQEVSTNG